MTLPPPHPPRPAAPLPPPLRPPANALGVADDILEELLELSPPIHKVAAVGVVCAEAVASAIERNTAELRKLRERLTP